VPGGTAATTRIVFFGQFWAVAPPAIIDIASTTPTSFIVLLFIISISL
jgi:hypothetical protein